jgi:hypothetical protein
MSITTITRAATTATVAAALLVPVAGAQAQQAPRIYQPKASFAHQAPRASWTKQAPRIRWAHQAPRIWFGHRAPRIRYLRAR